VEALAKTLELHVRRLAGYIGERNLARPDALGRAGLYIEQCLTASGLETRREDFEVPLGPTRNVVAETEAPGGRPFLLVGAHYDTAPGTPGADDNASGVAVLLEVAARLGSGERPKVPVRLAAFACEEPPHFGTPEMGSFVHARGMRSRGERLLGMLSLEMLGCYDSRPGSQSYPPLLSRFYPATGDFLALVSNLGSRDFMRSMARALDSRGVTLETAALPRWVPGVGLSDQASFWKHGYPAAMLTDTAMYRNPRYHGADDTPETLDYPRMAALVEALSAALKSWI